MRFASIETGLVPEIPEETFEDRKYRVTRGDYSKLLKLVVDQLSKAKVNYYYFFSS